MEIPKNSTQHIDLALIALETKLLKVKDLWGKWKKSPYDNELLVELNVGGEKISSLYGTLTKYSDSLLAKTIIERTLTDREGIIFIDRNPKYFHLVLDYLREGRLPVIDSTAKRERFFDELKYFGLPYQQSPALPQIQPDNILSRSLPIPVESEEHNKDDKEKKSFVWKIHHTDSTLVQLSPNGKTAKKNNNPGWNVLLLSDKSFNEGKLTWSIVLNQVNQDRSGLILGFVSDLNISPSSYYSSCYGVTLYGTTFMESFEREVYPELRQAKKLRFCVDMIADSYDITSYTDNEQNDITLKSRIKPKSFQAIYPCVFMYYDDSITVEFDK